MPLWLILALYCILSWGIWEFLAKLATAKGMHPVALSAISSLATTLTAWIAFFFLAGAPWDKTYGHIPFALVVGVLPPYYHTPQLLFLGRTSHSSARSGYCSGNDRLVIAGNVKAV